MSSGNIGSVGRLKPSEAVDGNDDSGWKRASTDWFHDAGWGVFCHFCFHSPPEMSAGADALSEKGGRIPEAFMAHLRAIGAAMGRRSMAGA